jgi:hypothetical protein
VICLSVLYLLGAFWGIAEAFVRFPMFFLGYTLRGNSASVFGIVLAAIEVALGVGLLRRMKLAWVASLVLNGLGLIYTLEMFNPSYRAKITEYQQEIMSHTFAFNGITPSPPPANDFGTYVGFGRDHGSARGGGCFLAATGCTAAVRAESSGELTQAKRPKRPEIHRFLTKLTMI